MTKGINPEINELLAMRYCAAELQLFNPNKVNSVTNGINASHARGRGMDFDEVRRYQAGDDIRLIHWPLTARSGKTYTKVYHEERERSVYLLIDQSASMRFATKVAFKSVIAARIAALLGWAALAQHQQVGGVVFDELGAEYIKPRRSRQSLLDVFNLLTYPRKNRQQGGLANSLQFILRQIQSGSTVIVLSDFCNLISEAEQYLRLIAHKCELINLLVYDPLEANLPDRGIFSFTDNGSARLEIGDTLQTKERYAQPFAKRVADLRNLSRQNRMQFMTLATNDDLAAVLKAGVNRSGK
jgi:uncharacterized protein (DUF58 family)